MPVRKLQLFPHVPGSPSVVQMFLGGPVQGEEMVNELSFLSTELDKDNLTPEPFKGAIFSLRETILLSVLDKAKFCYSLTPFTNPPAENVVEVSKSAAQGRVGNLSGFACSGNVISTLSSGHDRNFTMGF